MVMPFGTESDSDYQVLLMKLASTYFGGFLFGAALHYTSSCVINTFGQFTTEYTNGVETGIRVLVGVTAISALIHTLALLRCVNPLTPTVAIRVQP